MSKAVVLYVVLLVLLDTIAISSLRRFYMIFNWRRKSENRKENLQAAILKRSCFPGFYQIFPKKSQISV